MTTTSPHPIQSLLLSRAFTSLVIFLALATTALAQDAAKKPEPDVIVFSNGDQLTGTVERGAGDSVVFKSDMAGEITVPFSKIKELRAHGQFALLRKDTKTPTTNVQEGTVGYADSKVTLSSSTGTLESVEPKNVDFIIEQSHLRQAGTRPRSVMGRMARQRHRWRNLRALHAERLYIYRKRSADSRYPARHVSSSKEQEHPQLHRDLWQADPAGLSSA